MIKKITCPECGHHYTIELPKIKAIRRKMYKPKGNNFENAIMLDADPEELAHEYGQSDQLLESGLFGCFVFGGAACLLAIVDHLGVVPMSPETLALTAGAIGFYAGGKTYLMLTERSTYISRISSKLANLVPPPPDPGEVRIVVKEEKAPGNFTQYLGQIPCSREQFTQWAMAALDGGSIAIGQWYGVGKPFSRKEYEELIEFLKAYPRSSPIVKKFSNANHVTTDGLRVLKLIVKEWGLPSPLLGKKG